MKSLKVVILESILDDIDVQMREGDKFVKDTIKDFLKANFKHASTCKISRRPNSDGKYVVNAQKIEVKNTYIKSLTNDSFVWGTVKEFFSCAWCNSLTTLEGAPEEAGSFICSYCDSLTSLKGAPKKVANNFKCSDCKSLTSLEGAPEEVGGVFTCSSCRTLTSLKGAP